MSGMKRVIERLQTENDSLKNRVKKRGGGKGEEERSVLKIENKRLKVKSFSVKVYVKIHLLYGT